MSEVSSVLCMTDLSDRRLPVPRYYWKILFSPSQKAGVAVVGVNNPHLKVVTSHVPQSS